MAAPSFPEVELALTSTALAGDAGGLYRLATDLMDNGVPFDSLLFDYLIPTEKAVGKRWEQGDYLVAEEHAVTAAIETVISLLTGMFDQPEGAPLIVVATAEGDDHSLPARAAAAHLLYLGYRTSFLGANVPGDDLREFLQIETPSSLVLSAAMTIHLLGARAVIEAAHSVGVPVVAGGKAFGDDGAWAEAVGADAWVGSLRDVSDAVDQLIGRDDTTLREPVSVTQDLKDLIAIRSALLAEAEDELAGTSDGPVSKRLRDELELLLSAVEGALLTNDDKVVTDMLAWQQNALQAHDYDGSVVAEALQIALDASETTAGDLLSRTRERLNM
jgi:methanogenic corrinoid protein MtbC1